MNSQMYNPSFDHYTYNNTDQYNQNILVLNKNQNNSNTMLSDKYSSSLENNSVFSENNLKFQPSYDITEEFYKLHLLKLQNETLTQNKYNPNQQTQDISFEQPSNNYGYKAIERESYDIETYEPPTYESWEEEEDLDMVIDLNRSTSMSSGIFQFEDANRDFQLNNQFQNCKL